MPNQKLQIKKGKFTEAQIIVILNEQTQQDVKIPELCRMHGMSETTFYSWRSKYGECHDHTSTIFTSQIPVGNWHEIIGEGTIADAILDRIIPSAHRISLTGKSLRKKVDQ